MNEAQAEAEAQRCNRELGERGEEYRFYMAVCDADGQWTAQLHEERQGWFRRLTDAMFSMPN